MLNQVFFSTQVMLADEISVLDEPYNIPGVQTPSAVAGVVLP
jgi:hypothetical protein